MLEEYRNHVAERVAMGIPPLALKTNQTLTSNKLPKAPTMEAGIS